jgi:hypothetical protein
MKLIWPATEYLSGYIKALERGWSPDNRRADAGQEELARIADDSARFLAEQIDREAKGPKVTLPDGGQVPRLPGYSQWMWDGDWRGYATRALALILSEAKKEGLPFVQIVTDADNIASQKVIEANGGKLVNQKPHGEVRGDIQILRYRIFFEQVTT